jgi:hypothetical protein
VTLRKLPKPPSYFPPCTKLTLIVGGAEFCMWREMEKDRERQWESGAYLQDSQFMKGHHTWHKMVHTCLFIEQLFPQLDQLLEICLLCHRSMERMTPQALDHIKRDVKQLRPWNYVLDLKNLDPAVLDSKTSVLWSSSKGFSWMPLLCWTPRIIRIM